MKYFVGPIIAWALTIIAIHYYYQNIWLKPSSSETKITSFIMVSIMFFLSLQSIYKKIKTWKRNQKLKGK